MAALKATTPQQTTISNKIENFNTNNNINNNNISNGNTKSCLEHNVLSVMKITTVEQ